MKIAYFDCSAGISGDMCLGAVVDAGAALPEIARVLKRLPVKGYRLAQRRVVRGGIAATKVDVVLTAASARQAAQGTRWAEIERTIRSARIPDGMKKKGLAVFRRLFDAEASVHGKRYTTVHLHETGAVDCMADIFGTLAGLELLGVESVEASPINVGGGSVTARHGVLPVPAPATMELLKGKPVFSSGAMQELATPTGAAILATVASRFGPMPSFTPRMIGLGAGARDIPGMPNTLRIIIGETAETPSVGIVSVIETNIDDMNPQVYEHLYERLFAAGALDIWMTQTIMKKLRPGILLSVLCEPPRKDAIISLILRETTSLGVRHRDTQRVCMQRDIRVVKTRYGKVRVKVASHELAGTTKYLPEYEDCKALAAAKGVPLLRVMDEAMRAAARTLTSVG